MFDNIWEAEHYQPAPINLITRSHRPESSHRVILPNSMMHSATGMHSWESLWQCRAIYSPLVVRFLPAAGPSKETSSICLVMLVCPALSWLLHVSLCFGQSVTWCSRQQYHALRQRAQDFKLSSDRHKEHCRLEAVAIYNLNEVRDYPLHLCLSGWWGLVLYRHK